jgi:hypothetical protein
MRYLLLATGVFAAFALISESVSAQTTVRPYIKKDGTYVAPHVRSKPNNTTLDNWSTKGNVNPYTGKAGTVDPFAPSGSSKRRY